MDISDDNVGYLRGQVRSPCVGVCKMDPVRSFCIGCLRTTQEIASWSKMSNSDKEKVLLLCKLRDTGN